MPDDSLNLDPTQIVVSASFGPSHSKYFSEAVELASSLPGYELDENNWHHVKVTLSLDEPLVWERLRTLCALAGRWKSSHIEIQGVPANTFWELDREIEQVRECYTRRETSGLGNDFCSGKDAPDEETTVFGCRLVRGVSIDGRNYRYDSMKWYQLGSVSDDCSQFQTDKNKIFEVIQKKTAGQLCTTCPAFSWARVREEVEELPDTVPLTDDSKFVVKRSEIDPSKVLGIKERDRYSEYGSGFGLRIGIVSDNEDDASGSQVTRNVPQVSYSDVAGQDRVLEQVRNVIELPLTHAQYFEAVGVEPQRGVLLYGPPGNGKTLIAKAVAGETDAHLEIINGPEILSKWVGESEENLRSVFDRARSVQPSIILIDEIDSLAPSRTDVTHQHDVRLVSQLLVLMDGIETRGRVVVIGTTNRLGEVDPALRRPGRFDYHIELPLPDQEGRRAILANHLQKLNSDPDIDTAMLAAQIDGFSGAEIAGLVRESGLIAIKRSIEKNIPADQTSVTSTDLDLAYTSLSLKRQLPTEDDT